MCGIVGVISKYRNGFTNDMRDAFDMMLWIDTFRGDDSTGVFLVDNIGNAQLAKEAVYAPRFMQTKEYQDLRSNAFRDGWALVGHNRNATRGTITDENAHPFVVDDNIVLVHNGSYYGDHKELKDVEVDSLAIAHAISEADDPEKALRKVNAAFALVWYNQDEKSINIVRNTARPLFIMEGENGYFFASEEAFLQLVKSKFFKNQKGMEITEVKDYHLHRYTLMDNKSTEFELTELDCSYTKHNPYKPSGDNHENHRWVGGVWTPKNHHATPPMLPRHPFKQTIPPANNEHREIDTTSEDCTNRLLGAMYEKCTTMKYEDYLKINQDLVTGQKVKVIINDLIEADDDPKTDNFLFIGQTLMNSKIHATFHIKESAFQKAVSATNDSVFEVEINRVTWKCTEPLDVKERRTSMEKWNGIVILHGKNPVPIYQAGGSDATQ